MDRPLRGDVVRHRIVRTPPRRWSRPPRRPGNMSVLVGFDTRLVVQGVGSAGAFHAKQMIEYGTQVVAGVKPGKGGSRVAGLEQLPIYDTVAETVARHGANTSVIYVPPPGAADAILEAAAAGIATIIVITEGIPARDMIRVKYVLDHEFPDVV